MRIRYLVRFGYGINGITRSVITQANALAAAGHQVEVVSLRRHSERPHFRLDPRVRMFPLIDDFDRDPSWWETAAALDERSAPLLGSGHARLKPPQRFSELEERECARYVGELRDGVLVTTQPPLSLFAIRYGSPHFVHIAQEHVNYDFYGQSMRQLMTEHFGKLDAIVTLTAADAAAYRRAFPADRGGPVIRQIPNALHRWGFPPAPLDRPVISAVGRLQHEKGFDLLIEAFEQVAAAHPDWQLRIYGAGPLKPALRSMIEQRHLYNHVLLMGPSDDLDAEYPKSSLLVLSSRYEGFGLVLLEAMAHGLPVVAFDCPHGPGEIIDHGRTGLLVPPQDVAALAAAVGKLIDSPELRAELGAAGRRKAERYRPEIIARQWEELFAELLAARGIPPG
ncbi:glycosyltransferase family 4 protein [uncultured Thermomonospora sp.]|uniref:glycosyltransferase family 4 protein n=2 Tax=Thermomonospora TaxID=2019 RepID=UPI000AEDFB08|nr:glycosyltransferase family 4 protein [uncultured Thermomonospora sp.]